MKLYKHNRMLFSVCLALTLVVTLISLIANGQRSVLERWASDNSISRSNPGNSFSGRRHVSRNRAHWHGCKTNYKFDYIQLTLLWSPGACATSPEKCTRIVNKHFTIHGMWPTTFNGTDFPEFCCFDNTFYYKEIEPIVPDLNEYWISYYDPNSNIGFWSHEWLKHGTCARDVDTLRGEKRYFGTTLELAKKLPIMQTLGQANIFPNNTQVYKSSDIQRNLLLLTGGKRIQIDCDLEHHQSVPLLKGLNFCFDSNLKFTDCPETKRRCQRDLYFMAN